MGPISARSLASIFLVLCCCGNFSIEVAGHQQENIDCKINSEWVMNFIKFRCYDDGTTKGYLPIGKCYEYKMSNFVLKFKHKKQPGCRLRSELNLLFNS